MECDEEAHSHGASLNLLTLKARGGEQDDGPP